MAKKQAPTPLPTAADRKAAIDQIVGDAAKAYGPGRVSRSEDTHSAYLLRRPTGILSLDIALAGGFPAAAPSVLVGPEGVGKDYLLWRTMAEAQRLYGEDFCAACYFTEFQPDKLYMKNLCGFQVAFSEGEILELDTARRSAGLSSLNAEQLDHYRHKVGTFVPIFGISADHGFDQLFQLIKSNFCQMVAVNSIGFLQTEAKEQTDSYEEFAQQRNEAMLLSKALPQYAMYLNQQDIWGRVNETSLLLVNQVRSKDAASRPMRGRPVQDKDTYKTAANSWALKHGKAIEVMMHHGPKIYDETSKPPLVLGGKRRWEITKGKLGTHEGLKGEFDYFFGYGVDLEGDLLNVAIAQGVVEVAGSWITYNDDGFKLKAQGMNKATDTLREDLDLMQHLRQRCLAQAEIICRTR